jgi:hypothetical protein
MLGDAPRTPKTQDALDKPIDDMHGAKVPRKAMTEHLP